MHSKRASFQEEIGGATAEFVMTSALLTLIALALVQFGIILYSRAILIDAVSAGARHASLADRTLEDGLGRAQDMIDGSIPGDLNESLTGQIRDGKVSISVSAKVPLVGFISSPIEMSFVGQTTRFVDE